MAMTKEQKALLKAIRDYDTDKVDRLLNDDGVDPDVGERTTTTPLHEAVRIDSLEMVEMILEAGALVETVTRDGYTALDLADQLAGTGIIRRLEREAKDAGVQGRHKKYSIFNDNWDDDGLVQTPPPSAGRKTAGQKFNDAAGGAKKPKKETFTPETLPKIFDPDKWVGKISQMQEEWKRVPKRLHKKFDFVSAFNAARQKTLQAKAPPPVVLKKKAVPKKIRPGSRPEPQSPQE